jgi:ribose-phosphate pyrophosphokinase
MSKVKLFSGTATLPLAQEIARHFGQPLGEMTLTRFADGEFSPSFNESVRGEDVFLVQSTIAPSDNLMELLLMIDAARRASAKYVTVVVPYFGYARQDRKDKPRVSIAAKLVANLLTAAGTDRLMTCDLHAGQIQGFFDFPVDHLDGNAVFVPYLETLNLDNLIFASPDVGGLARARRYAKHFGVEMVVCDKERKKSNVVESMQLLGDVEGKDVVLVDDLVDTAGTICKAADLIMEKGARSVRAICTHAVLSGNALDKINASGLQELVVTDTIAKPILSEKVKVLSVARLFATAVRRVHGHESISTLFI